MADQTDKANAAAAGVSDQASSSAGKGQAPASDASKSPASAQTTGAGEAGKAPAARTVEDIARDRGLSLGNADRVAAADRKDNPHAEDHRTPEQIKADQEAEAARSQSQSRPGDTLGRPVAAPIPGDAEDTLRQHDQLDEAKDRLNEHNEPGHAKNMARIEDEAERAQDATKRTVPTGKEDNRNTPIVDPKTGAKRWV